MKIIIRNRSKKIEVSNITSKEEMVWIDPDKYSQITTDAGTMAAEFMQKHPQIHEVKFSVLPELDKDEDEDEFYDSEDNENQTDRDNDEQTDTNQHHCGQDAGQQSQQA
ncbi:MAG: hypothetical protein K6G08_09745 [Prevotella sp.]|nr:hypothetical protein [Prevotella sp.]